MNFDHLSHLWRQINVQWYQQLTKILVENNLTHTDRMVLVGVKALGQPTKSELAQVVNVRPQSLTRSIDRLSETGLVEKIENSTDRRFVRLGLTTKSKPILEQLDNQNEYPWKTMAKGIPQEKMEWFAANLEVMLKNLEKGLL